MARRLAKWASLIVSILILLGFVSLGPTRLLGLAATGVYDPTNQVVDSAGNVLDGVASAKTGVADLTARIVDSTGHVIDSFVAGTSGGSRCQTNLQSGTLDAQVAACIAAMPSGGTIDSTGYASGSRQSFTSTINISASAQHTYTWLVDLHNIEYRCEVTGGTNNCINIDPGNAIIDLNASSRASGPPPGGFTTLSGVTNVVDYLKATNQGPSANGVGLSLRGLHIACVNGTVSEALVNIPGLQQTGTVESMNLGGCTPTSGTLYLGIIQDSPTFGLTGLTFNGNGHWNCVGATRCAPLLLRTTNNGVYDTYFYDYQFNHPGTGQCHITINAAASHSILHISFYDTVLESSFTNNDGVCVTANGSVENLMFYHTSLSNAGQAGTNFLHILIQGNLDNLQVFGVTNNGWTNIASNNTSGSIQAWPCSGCEAAEWKFTRSISSSNQSIWTTANGVMWDYEPVAGQLKTTLPLGGLVAPSVATCGTGALQTGSNSMAGTIAMAGATACTLTTGFTCPNKVVLALNDETAANKATMTASTTTTATFSTTANTDVVDYVASCR